MTAWAHAWATLEGRGVRMAAISVDSTESLRRLRGDLGLKSELLSDSDRQVVRAWHLLNTAERGGIAFPATFVVDMSGTITYRSLDRTASRADVSGVLGFLQELEGNRSARLENRQRKLQVPSVWDAVVGLPRKAFGRR